MTTAMISGGWINARITGKTAGGVTITLPADAVRAAKGEVLVKVRRYRNPKHHRKMWALLRVVAESTDRWNSVDHLHLWLKIRCGHVDAYQLDGREVLIPKSIAYGSMGQDDFERYYMTAMNILAEETGIDPEAMAREVAHASHD